MHYCYLQECPQETVESILYTTKEVNSVAGCCVYTSACICCIDLLPEIRKVCQKAFVNTEVLFWCDDTVKGTNNRVDSRKVFCIIR